MSFSSIHFNNPWFLLLLLPALILGLYPYLRLPKNHRRTRNKVVPTVLHLIILFIVVLIFSGLTFKTNEVNLKSDIIILADISSSNNKNVDKMNQQIKKILDDSDPRYNIGIVTFANDSIYASSISNNAKRVYDDYINLSIKPDVSATNIASAFDYSLSLLSNPKKGRIILLSDGLETDGNALTQAKVLAEQGVVVDAIYFNSDFNNPEVQINDISVEENPTINKDTTITVTLQSKNKGSGTLILYDNDEEIIRREIIYTGKIDKYNFTHKFTTPQVRVLHAKIEVNDDEVIQNNVVYEFVNIGLTHKILIVDGSGKEVSKIKELLDDIYEIDVVSPKNVPTNLTKLSEYSEVILMNVPFKDLPLGFDTLLINYVNKLGGGLFTVGGDNSFYNGYTPGSFYDQLLPVDLTLGVKNTAFMIVLDKSSSMVNNQVPGTGKNRLEIAKEAAITCIESMNNSDYVGVVTFASNNEVKLDVPLSPVTQKVEINRIISGITNSTGTQYYNALDLAANELKAFDKANNKHIILISDGSPTDPRNAFENLVATLPNTEPTSITLSTMSIGSDENVAVLSNLATLGQGRFYQIRDVTKLSELLIEETKTIQTDYENLGNFTPIIRSYNPVVRGITRLPEITGYIGTTPKSNANVILSTKDGDPLYATRQFGLGKVAAFMSDLNGTWSSSYFSDGSGKTFIKNAVNSLLSQAAGSDIFVDFENINYSTILKINTITSENNEIIKASVVTPSGKTSDIEIRNIGENAFVGLISTKEAGLYTVKITKTNELGGVLSEVYRYTTFSYSKEYNPFIDASIGKEYLELICKEANGQLMDIQNLNTDVFFADPVITVSEFDPLYILVVAVIILFLLDLIARKFKFKWPHELFNKELNN